MTAEPLQQANMFTGAWETKRGPRARSEQTQMFTLRETFEFGARVRSPVVEAGTPTLQLTREDVRTPDEVERDLMREAEALTSPLFTNNVVPESADTLEQDELDSETDHALPAPASEKVTKLSCYRALVDMAHEQAVTLWVDEAYRARFYNQLPEAILSAQGAGLTATEISTAMQIGAFHGKREREAVPQSSGATFAALTSPRALLGTSAVTEPVSFRSRLRHEHIIPTTRQWGCPIAFS